jgi:hypothetical protein
LQNGRGMHGRFAEHRHIMQWMRHLAKAYWQKKPGCR